MLENIYLAVSVICGWIFLTRLQSGFIIFATIKQYFFGKLIFAAMIGIFITPIYAPYLLYKYFFKR